jgi:hypothetical protein
MKRSKQQKYDSSSRLPVVETLAVRSVIEADDCAVEFRKLNEIADLLWLPKGLAKAERNIRIVRALELYEDLKPVGSAEGMLAAQMVGTHSAALECLRRAVVEGQTFEGRDMALKHAQKLMALYTQQLAALDKHRGKGQQKVTVEHVHAQAGGQAIVGNVDMCKRSADGREDPKAVEYGPEVPLPTQPPKRKASKLKRPD